MFVIDTECESVCLYL